MIYASTSTALAVLEALVHTEADTAPDDLVAMEIEVDEQSMVRCVMRGRRNRDANWTEVVWDMDRARKMGLTTSFSALT